MNISSAIVHTQAAGLDRVRGLLQAMPGIEVHAADEARLVVSIESAGDQETADAFASIQALDGVLSASLVYCHFESDPDKEIGNETDAA